jgi:predicted regulator of Ras-like GTPase activity (Roadblock/LC7/MglB family)
MLGLKNGTDLANSDLGPWLQDSLERLVKRVPGLLGAIITDPNGLPLATQREAGLDLTEVAAEGVLLGQSVVSAFAALRASGPEVLIAEGQDVGLAIAPLRDSGINLLAVYGRSTNVGLLKVELKRAALRLSEGLGLGAAEVPAIVELFVMDKGGILIRHYSDARRSEPDQDIVCGMLLAVQEFVKQALAFKGGDLEELRFGDYTVCFSRGTYTIVAAVVDGPNAAAIRYPLADALQIFEERFRAVLPHWNGDPAPFVGMDACFSKIVRNAAGSS